ncbi:hypothetical protein B296_00057279 [Ensete ventricosum]|uniref:Uncharacterized protein n=1 Tax=Ensete ventricosum TaxID=4639 RepID=A0A426XRW3_ENSVE|nr:hypothetical protein B296_00057279 [Ensete ventricosum]
MEEGAASGVAVSDIRLEAMTLGRGYIEEGMAGSDERGKATRRSKLQREAATPILLCATMLLQRREQRYNMQAREDATMTRLSLQLRKKAAMTRKQ